MTHLNQKLAAQWKDAANLMLGLWLVGSPWALGYATHQYATWNAWVVGAVVAVAALAALIAFQTWEEWVSAVLGAWLVVSPYVLGYGTLSAAAMNHVIVGVLVVVLAVWAAMSTESDHLLTKS